MSGKVSILIPTMFDSRYTIELCLKSIKKNTNYPDYEIIVCDSGVDEIAHDYLTELADNDEIKLIKATDWQRPKDDLVKVVDSEYYLLMHDDTQILKRDWVTKRVMLMNRSPRNAIVGTIVKNYSRQNRFFPLGLLVKSDVSRKLDLRWGKQPGLDTGAIAYAKFFSQNEYLFVNYKVSRDIKHFSEMTWPKYHNAEDYPGLDKKLQERDDKIIHIKNVLAREAY